MAMHKQILDKLARDLTQLGQTVTRSATNDVVVANGSNAVTISYADAVFTPSMLGGVDGSVSPFLGIGVGNPGTITMRVASEDTLAGALAFPIAVICLHQLGGFANDVQLLVDSTGAQLLRLRGNTDIVNMGQ